MDTNNDTASTTETQQVESTPVESTQAETIITDNVTEQAPFDFKSAMSEEYRDNPNINKYKSLDDLAKGLLNQSKLLGRDKVVIPTDGNDDEFSEYMSKVGKPENVDGYNIDMPEIDGLSGDAMDIGDFKEMALKNNMTQSQLQGMMSWYSDKVVSATNEINAGVEEKLNSTRNELRKELGAAYDESIGRANSFIKSKMPSLSGDLLAKVGNDPSFIRDIMNISKNFSESDIGKPQESRVSTPAEARAERDSLMRNPAYMDVKHPEHKAVEQRAIDLIPYLSQHQK